MKAYPTQKYFRALTIAGSDSGGGAGIQADLKTFSAIGCYGASVITALTAQNTVAVKSIFPVSSEFIVDQLTAVLEDIGADAIKIGMLHRTDVISAVVSVLKNFSNIPIVLDPVMIAKSGDHLLQSDAIKKMKEELFPMTSVLTPNLPEASALLGRNIQTPEEMERAARDLSNLGPRTVVVKGGHSEDTRSRDCVFIRGSEIFWLDSPRIDTKNLHGTGCTFSSAIAAYLARGESISNAIRSAKTYITQAISEGANFRLGHGHGPVDHFYQSPGD